MHILMIGGISRSLINFRGSLIQAMLAAGHKVTACAGEPRVEAAATLKDWGVDFLPVNLARAGMSPLGDLRACLQLQRIMRALRPDVVLSYTIKPVIWRGIAARLAGIRNAYSLITGLGYVFMDKGGDASVVRMIDGWKQQVAKLAARVLYKTSLKYSSKVFFQNPDDEHDFIDMGLVRKEQTVVVSGSGVDTAFFASALLPDRLTFLLVARLLVDKGVREYATAARLLALTKTDQSLHDITTNREVGESNKAVAFMLAGNLDPNPASIDQAELDEWKDAGFLEYLGYLDDVRAAYERCSVYVLPSYREGTPRTVLEAMAMGRAIITTDAPGCRETVRRKGGMQDEEGRVQSGEWEAHTLEEREQKDNHERHVATG